MIPVLLMLVILALAILGAGIFPGVITGIAAALCLACLCVSEKRARKPGLLAIAATSLVALTTLTVLPLPHSMEWIVGKKRAAQNRRAEAAIEQAAELNIVRSKPAHFSVSRNRAGTLRLLALMIAGFAAAVLGSRLAPESKNRFLKCLVALGAAVALAGYVSQWIVPQGKTLWWLFPVSHGRPVGCFINRNHFGGFVAMLCPAALLLFTDNLSRKKWVWAFVWAAGFGVMSLAVVMSLSRGAWFAALVAGLALALLALARQRIVIALLIPALMAGAVWIVARQPHRELDARMQSVQSVSETPSAAMRLQTWRDSIRILPAYAWLGTGANGFRAVFPQYRTASMRKSFIHVENEYIQIPVEFGLIGTACIVLLIAGVAARWRICRREGTISRAVDLAVAGAVVVACVHALVDFPIRVPLYFVVLCALIGLVLSRQDPPVSDRTRGSGARLRLMAIPIAATIVIVFLSFQGGRPQRMDNSDTIQSADAETLRTALIWSPASWHVWYHFGNAAIESGKPGSYRFGEQCVTQAAEYDPLNCRLWTKLYYIRRYLNDTEGMREARQEALALRPWVRL